MKTLRTIALMLAAVWLPATIGMARQEGVPTPFTDLAGPEKWIDGPDAVQPSNDPRYTDTAVANDGTRIHVWESFGTDRLDIFFRRFDADGNPLNDPTRVNTTFEDEQQSPRVAVSADGSFLVIFTNVETPPGETFPQKMVRSQAYNATGDPVGGEQLVSTVPTKETTDVYADVAALRTSDGSPGGYAVVWRNSDFTPEWGDIHASIVSASGVPGAEFNVHSDDTGGERWSSVTELPNGGFLVVWVETATQEVRGRIFNSAGGPLGGEFEITTADNAAPGSYTDVALGWDGRVLVVWVDGGSETPPLPPGSGAIRGRMYQFDPAGNDLDPLGNDFRINNLFAGIQDEPRIADFGAVGFLVIWGSAPGGAGPDTNQSVESRVVSGNNAFDADGDGNDDPQVQFNTWADGGQNLLGAHGWYGRIGTSWQSQSWDGEPEPDTINQLVITGRDIEYCLFCDDFEWYVPGGPGSLWRWTSTLGLVP